MFEKRPPTIDTVRAVLTSGPVKLRFAEDTKPILLDALTASAMIAIYDALDDRKQAKVRDFLKSKASFMRYVNFCWKHVKVAA